MRSNVVRDVVRFTPVLALLVLPAPRAQHGVTAPPPMGSIEGRIRDSAGASIGYVQVSIVGTEDRDGYRADFVQMVEQTRGVGIASRPE